MHLSSSSSDVYAGLNRLDSLSIDNVKRLEDMHNESGNEEHHSVAGYWSREWRILVRVFLGVLLMAVSAVLDEVGLVMNFKVSGFDWLLVRTVIMNLMMATVCWRVEVNLYKPLWEKTGYVVLGVMLGSASQIWYYYVMETLSLWSFTSIYLMYVWFSIAFGIYLLDQEMTKKQIWWILFAYSGVVISWANFNSLSLSFTSIAPFIIAIASAILFGLVPTFMHLITDWDIHCYVFWFYFSFGLTWITFLDVLRSEYNLITKNEWTSSFKMEQYSLVSSIWFLLSGVWYGLALLWLSKAYSLRNYLLLIPYNLLTIVLILLLRFILMGSSITMRNSIGWGLIICSLWLFNATPKAIPKYIFEPFQGIHDYKTKKRRSFENLKELREKLL